MRVLLATGEHRQQKGSKAYTLDICKTSLSQKYIFNYRVIPSLSGLARSPTQMVPQALPAPRHQMNRHRAGPAEVRGLKRTRRRGVPLSPLAHLGLSWPPELAANPKFGEPRGSGTATPRIHVSRVIRRRGRGLSFC